MAKKLNSVTADIQLIRFQIDPEYRKKTIKIAVSIAATAVIVGSVLKKILSYANQKAEINAIMAKDGSAFKQLVFTLAKSEFPFLTERHQPQCIIRLFIDLNN